MPETTPLIKAALNLRAGAGFDVYELRRDSEHTFPFIAILQNFYTITQQFHNALLTHSSYCV